MKLSILESEISDETKVVSLSTYNINRQGISDSKLFVQI